MILPKPTFFLLCLSALSVFAGPAPLLNSVLSRANGHPPGEDVLPSGHYVHARCTTDNKSPRYADATSVVSIIAQTRTKQKFVPGSGCVTGAKYRTATFVLCPTIGGFSVAPSEFVGILEDVLEVSDAPGALNCRDDEWFVGATIDIHEGATAESRIIGEASFVRL